MINPGLREQLRTGEAKMEKSNGKRPYDMTCIHGVDEKLMGGPHIAIRAFRSDTHEAMHTVA